MSKPNVFIIESLRFDDEEKERFEGKIISQILHLNQKHCLYYYIRTKKELKKILNIFEKSTYRYLHISCHGNGSSLFTTLDGLSFKEFGDLVRPFLNKKRLFISSCSAVNMNLAKEIFQNSNCLSLIGPVKEIYFSDAAIIWASFYHLMFKENPNLMKGADIRRYLQNLVNTFRVPLNYFNLKGRHQINPEKIQLVKRNKIV